MKIILTGNKIREQNGGAMQVGDYLQGQCMRNYVACTTYWGVGGRAGILCYATPI